MRGTLAVAILMSSLFLAVGSVQAAPSSTSTPWAATFGGSGGDIVPFDSAVGPNGDIWITGYFEGSVTIGTTTLQSAGETDVFVARVDNKGNWKWALSGGGSAEEHAGGIVVDNSGNAYIAGYFADFIYRQAPVLSSFGSSTLYSHEGYIADGFVAKVSSSGSWTWAVNSPYDNSWNANGGAGLLLDIVFVSSSELKVAGTYAGDMTDGSTTISSTTDSQGYATLDGFLGSISTSGGWSNIHGSGGAGFDQFLALNTAGSSLVTSFSHDASTTVFGRSHSLSGGSDTVIAKFNPSTYSASWSTSVSGSVDDYIEGVMVDSSGDVWSIGYSNSSTILSSSKRATTSGGKDILLAKMDGSSGTADWITTIGGSSEDVGYDFLQLSNGEVLISGALGGAATIIVSGSSVTTPAYGGDDAILAKITNTGTISMAHVSGGSGDELGLSVAIDSGSGDIFAIGILGPNGTSPTVIHEHSTNPSGATDGYVAQLHFLNDRDDDGFDDHIDACPDTSGTANKGTKIGCIDGDGDGWADIEDDYPTDITQWVDTDGDGYGDEASGTNADGCPNEHGTSTRDRLGCSDFDQDGSSDPDDDWTAMHGADAFPSESTQWSDTDGDGFGDNWADSSWTNDRMAQNPIIGEWIDGAKMVDACPLDPGVAGEDRNGCTDTDGDGWSDENDAFPLEDSQWADTDGDGYGDNRSEGAYMPDAMPEEPTQWSDRDGDGWGDNKEQGAKRVDVFPDDSTQWEDSDGDGYGDSDLPGSTQPDACPDVEGTSTADRFGCPDTDNDGYSNPSSTWTKEDGADAFPSEQTQWNDTDGDELGDNYEPGAERISTWPGEPVEGAVDSDPWPLDSDNDGYSDIKFDDLVNGPYDDCPKVHGTSRERLHGCLDTDKDGWSNDHDEFEDEPTQWLDKDNDGYGNNQSEGAYHPDACPNVKGTSTIDQYGCPDSDGDGISDVNDPEPFVKNENVDTGEQSGDGNSDDTTPTSELDDSKSEGGQVLTGTGSFASGNSPSSEGNGGLLLIVIPLAIITLAVFIVLLVIILRDSEVNYIEEEGDIFRSEDGTEWMEHPPGSGQMWFRREGETEWSEYPKEGA